MAEKWLDVIYSVGTQSLIMRDAVRQRRSALELVAAVCIFVLATAPWVAAGERAGELRLEVSDASGATLQAHGQLVNQANGFVLQFDTSAEGEYVAKRMPFGTYRLTMNRVGFSEFNTLVNVRSEIPVKLVVVLAVAARSESITVNIGMLLDTTNPGTAYEIGSAALQQRLASTPGRALIDVVQQQPGWILESNGVLHPRGSEYQTQYVVDGVPTLDNRSPAFASEQDIDTVQSVKVYTSGIPAEFGRKLGGVVETVSARNPPRGFHGSADFAGSSFDTSNGYIGLGYVAGRNALALSGSSAHTDRYLDPPVQQNYTNSGTTLAFSTSFERDLTQKDRVRLALSHRQAVFLVPNELLQQASGQRQDRHHEETSGQVSYEHVFSSSLLGSLQGRVRDLSADLQSNPQSTPIQAFQERGFREAYIAGSLTAQWARHAIKIGADTIYSGVHERFSYRITTAEINGEPIFDPSTPPNFSFTGARLDREQAFYVQDEVRLGNVGISVGVRFDHYSLIRDETAWSPRLGVSWYLPKAGLVLRASYDRIFATPAVENLLLSTSASVRTLAGDVAQFPVRPSRGNYYEVGAAKELFHKARWSLNYFRRNIGNFADDDTLLDTAISFPIALHSASTYGAESQFALPQLGPFSAWVNYSYLVASVRLPASGGLFLGKDAAALLNSTRRIWASQDQRHTAHAEIRYQRHDRFWAAFAGSYGSGLQVDINGEDPAILIAEFGPAVVSRVNPAAGRVRPSGSSDVSAGVQLWKKERRSVHLQGGIRNLTDRLNVINFASVFSGTALASPRTFSARLRLEF
jgi:outer membrane cobalamin receptor